MKAAFVAIALAAVSVLAEETAIEVPQGTGQFPTIGQVACLEESGGSLCAATYECADGATGELWGDMETHDGRAGIGASSPVSTGRGCVIAVDGKASVKWFTGHSADGALVGIAPNHAALRPIQRIQRTGGRGGNLLDYILEATDTTFVRDRRRAVRPHPRRAPRTRLLRGKDLRARPEDGPDREQRRNKMLVRCGVVHMGSVLHFMRSLPTGSYLAARSIRRGAPRASDRRTR